MKKEEESEGKMERNESRTNSAPAEEVGALETTSFAMTSEPEKETQTMLEVWRVRWEARHLSVAWGLAGLRRCADRTRLWRKGRLTRKPADFCHAIVRSAFAGRRI